MENDEFFKATLDVLREIREELRELSHRQSLLLPQDEDKLMTRQDVQEYLMISETTYKVQVKKGLLKPMIMPGGHRYRKRDLDTARAESVRRGRI